MFKWKKVNLQEELKKYLKIAVFYDNVSRVTALGELLYGVGKKHKNFICVNVGFGIGAGIIINGEPFFGNRGFSGEFGHIIVNHNSPHTDADGIRGCIEALSSGYGIAEIAKDQINSGKESSILRDVNGNLEKITAEIVINAAKEEDILALKIVDEAMTYLGIGIDSLIKLFNPEIIVFSGGLAKSGEIFFNKLEKHILENLSLIHI